MNKSYKEVLLKSVTEHMYEVLKLINIIIPQLKTVLVRQKRDKGIINPIKPGGGNFHPPNFQPYIKYSKQA